MGLTGPSRPARGGGLPVGPPRPGDTRASQSSRDSLAEPPVLLRKVFCSRIMVDLAYPASAAVGCVEPPTWRPVTVRRRSWRLGVVVHFDLTSVPGRAFRRLKCVNSAVTAARAVPRFGSNPKRGRDTLPGSNCADGACQAPKYTDFGVFSVPGACLPTFAPTRGAVTAARGRQIHVLGCPGPGAALRASN